VFCSGFFCFSGVKKLPVAAQEIWMTAFNKAHKNGKEKNVDNLEQYAFTAAWSAVKQKYEQTDTIEWVAKEADMEINIEQVSSIRKIDIEKQIVWGIVYEPNKVDSQGDFATADEIEKACHGFLRDYNQIGLMHEDTLSKQQAVTVESYIAPMDFVLGNEIVKQGSWVMAVHIQHNDIWQKVKTGEIAAFSMGGLGKRRV